jgi:hypothetical protein
MKRYDGWRSSFLDYSGLPINDAAPQRHGLDVENVSQGDKEPTL